MAYKIEYYPHGSNSKGFYVQTKVKDNTKRFDSLTELKTELLNYVNGQLTNIGKFGLTAKEFINHIILDGYMWSEETGFKTSYCSNVKDYTLVIEKV